MSRELTDKQKGFANDKISGKTGVESALNNYDTDDYNTAGVIAHENLKKPKIQEYIEGLGKGAITRIEQLSRTAKNEQVKLSANKDIADRAGLKAVEKTDLNVSGGLDLISILEEADKEK